MEIKIDYNDIDLLLLWLSVVGSLSLYIHLTDQSAIMYMFINVLYKTPEKWGAPAILGPLPKGNGIQTHSAPGSIKIYLVKYNSIWESSYYKIHLYLQNIYKKYSLTQVKIHVSQNNNKIT